MIEYLYVEKGDNLNVLRVIGYSVWFNVDILRFEVLLWFFIRAMIYGG